MQWNFALLTYRQTDRNRNAAYSKARVCFMS